MLFGHVRDHLPRVFLSLPGRDGQVSIEFIVDTGFDGDLALPGAILSRLAAAFSTERELALADGSMRRFPFYEVLIEWGAETRLTEITVLEGNPLLGAALLDGFTVHIDMTDGGDVQIEPM